MAEFNPYADREYAIEYLEFRLGTSDWDNATEKQQRAALMMAAEDIDKLPFRGFVTLAGQPRRFPRNGDQVVPEAVKKANVELALEYLKGVDPHEEYALLTRREVMYGTIREQRHESLVEPHIVAGIPSLRAFGLLVPFLRDDRSVKLDRV